MRIALISTLARPVPPPGEGSVELLVSELAEHLVRFGHEVTLYGLANSKTTGRLRSPVETSYVTDSKKWDWQLYEGYQVREAFAAAEDFDVIHCHSYHFGLLFSDFISIPTVHSMHVEPGPDIRFLAERTRNRHLVFASQFQAQPFAGLEDIHVVPHGIDVAKFGVISPSEREGYLAYLGRFHPDKGPLQAIELARASGQPVKLAGPSNDYFRESILPLVDGEQVQYVGELNTEEKAQFLARAQALLYPVERGEPFGLVLVEALACGLPVLALNRGAVPEIVVNGQDGFIAESTDELVAALQKVADVDRETIRRRAVERFSSETMARRFEALYQQAIDEPRTPLRRALEQV